MARIRSVKPEICESETMARLSAEVERTFVRLWTHCDDHGRAKDHPGLIKAALFPLHDDVTPDVVDSHLAALAAEGLIVRYTVGGKRWLACPSWAEHQHPQKPRPSKVPDPSEADPIPVPEVSRTPTVAVPDESGPVVVVGVVGGEVEVGVAVEGEVAAPIDSQGYSGTPSADRSVDGDDGEPGGERVSPVDEQSVRAAARAVGVAIAAGRPGITSPGGYAASVTAAILAPDSDGIDRERIVRLLSTGLSPAQVAAQWTAAPLPDALQDPGPLRPALSPSVVDEIRAQAGAVADPAVVADALAVARANRVAS